MAEAAKVAVGLPVFNGENFLGEAIESILGQTYGDLRLFISDNCSTDGTQDICRHFAKLDNRIVYHRHDRNIGSAPNFSFTFKPEGSPYFKWAAHDDVLLPNFLAETVPLLDANLDATIAHGRSEDIDDTGNVTGDLDDNPVLCSESPSQRLWGILWTEYFAEIFGLMRSAAVAKTSLHMSFPGSDRNFMGEMMLLGKVVYSREVVFRRRNHEGAYVRARKSLRAKQRWLDPTVRFSAPPFLRKVYHYLKAIDGADLSRAERVACRAMLLKWIRMRASEELRWRVARMERPDVAARIRSYGLVSLKDHLCLGRAAVERAP